MSAITIIADDLTGAADAAALFAEAGLATLLPLGEGACPANDVVSRSTESRDLPPGEAAARVRETVARIMAGSVGSHRLLYKKLDSALRGNLAAELAAVMRASGADRALVAPALPAEGRTTVDGHQLVHGTRLEETAFGGPGSSGDLLAILAPAGMVRALPLAPVRAGGEALVRALAEPGTIVVPDAETEGDLDRIARAALDAAVPLLAGSAGLARALVRVGGFRAEHTPPGWRPAGRRPVLCIAGTRHEATARQVACAAAAGVTVLRPNQADLDDPEGGIDGLIADAGARLSAGAHVIVTTAGTRACPRGAAAVVERLASLAGSARVRMAAGGMILTGGDVAAGVCRVLGAEAIWLRGEVQPAIPWGTLAGGALPRLPIVTKAGSFGDDRTLLACIDHLVNARAGRPPGAEAAPLAAPSWTGVT